MNLRQKAKKYKKISERYKDKAEAWDSHIKTEMLKNAINRRYGIIDTLKIVKFWDDRVPDIFVKKEIANEIGKYCLENDLIYFEVDNYDGYNGMRRIVGTLKMVKPYKYDVIYSDTDSIKVIEEGR